MSIDIQIKEINSALKDVGDNLKSMAEKSEQQINAHAQLSAETKEKVDKLLTEQGALQARLKAAEQMLADYEGGKVTGRDKQTVGQWFASQDAVKAYQGGKLKLDVNAAIVADSVTGAGIVAPDYVADIKGGGQRQLRVRDLLSWGPTTSDSISYVRETGFTNAAAPVRENPTGNKPKSVLAFEMENAPIATIAHWVPASRQVLSDLGQMAAYIDGRLRYGLDLEEEEQLLKGSGTGLDLDGIFTQAANYSKPAGATAVAQSPIDVLRLALLQAELADYAADGIVVSPTSWANIELTKETSTAAYIFANPQAANSQMLWGRNVVSSGALGTNEFLVGNFALGAQGWDRQQATVGIAEQHEDFFTKNMVAILAEKRIGLTVYRPAAFVKGLLTGTGVST